MLFKYLLIPSILAQATGFGILTFGDGSSIFQKLVDRFYEIPNLLLGSLGNIAFQPETLMNVTQIIRYNGYTAEEHSIVTEDGYILGVQRILPKNIQSEDGKLNPVLFMHNYLGYSGNFVSNSPENAPAFLFAKAGFDVWLVNQRGTEYSRGHLNVNKADYWKYSLDEVAAFDLPACIDHMLNVTGHKQILYLGHSLGGALPFALLDTRAEYMTKIKAIYAFAPTVYLVNISETVKASALAAPLYQRIADRLGVHEYPKFPPQLAGYAGQYFDSFVRQYLFSFYGADYEQWNSSRTEVNLAHLYTSSSTFEYYHITQLIRKPGFRKFDWGERINRQKYGQPNPPDYNISAITVPTHVYYGDNDWFAPINNAQFLIQRLKNAHMHVAGKHWNNLDFLWAKDAGKEFYNGLISSIKNRI